jgi:CheY-like chemotaxis protein
MAKVLIVDDESMFRNLVADMLQQAGHEGVKAESAPAALALLAHNSAFDLIMSDMRMFEMDGILFVEELKGKYPTIPVIIVSAYPEAYWGAKALNKGAAGYLQKPFGYQQLVETVQKYVPPPE